MDRDYLQGRRDKQHRGAMGGDLPHCLYLTTGIRDRPKPSRVLHHRDPVEPQTTMKRRYLTFPFLCAILGAQQPPLAVKRVPPNAAGLPSNEQYKKTEALLSGMAVPPDDPAPPPTQNTTAMEPAHQ